MMYVIYNNDGSIKLTNLNEIITQNSNNVSKIFFAVEGYDTDNYNADATFELSNGDANTLVATISSMTLDTTPYVGWEFSLTNAQTASPGRLLASIELKNLSDVVLFTFPLELFVNKTTLQPDETTITVAQYNNLRNAMLGKQDKFGLNTLRIYQTMGDANADLSNLVLGQLVYVIAENKLFQVDGSPKALVLTNDNYIKQYPYNETATLQTIYDEVGLNKLFYAKLDNRWQLLMLQETSGNYSFVFWDELGYGETDTTQSLSETINNLTFHYTGFYFPYVEKNNLGGSLTDEELAILSQPNAVFICLGNIFHKVDSTRFERIIVSSSGSGGTGILTTLLYITINTSTKTFSFNNSYFSSYSTAGVDNLLAQKQDLLINQFNIKSINGQSILGSGNLDVGGGSGNVEWGNIGGDITDQTDLQNELQDIRETAEGKCKSVVLSYSKTAPTNNSQAQAFKKLDGTNFTDLADFSSYVSGLYLRNSIFDSQNDALTYPSNNSYFISSENVVYRGTDFSDNFKTGDIFIITEIDVPDRWLEIYVSGMEMLSFHKLETSKVDLTNYATKTELANAIASLNANLAGLYDETLVYAIGQVVIHDNLLWSANTNINTPEAWDSTHWTQTTIANEFVNLHGSQVIDGDKNFTGELQKSGIDVADINHAFNVINASEMTDSQHFTQAQLDLIKNGKPTKIIGSLYGNLYNVLFLSCQESTNFLNILLSYANADIDKGISYVQITKADGYVNIRTNKIYFGLNSIYLSTDNGSNLSIYLNGKKLANYPSNTGTFVNKMVDGTLSWQQEWYGTQAEYDALGTYDSNTIYNILEN